MADIPDLSKLRAVQNGADHQDENALADLSEEDRAELERLAEENEPDAEQVVTAFVVYVQRDLTVQVSPDLGIHLVRDSMPSADAVYGACSVVLRDFGAAAAAENVVNTQMALSQQIAQQQQEMRLRQSLGDPRGPQR
jgi:hypothetical protein